MADPVLGTAAPTTFPIPNWLLAWEQTTTSDAHILVNVDPGQPAPSTYQKVKLHDFTFLGRTFAPAQYSGFSSTAANRTVVRGPLTVTGVCNELKDFLIAAQRDVFQGFAARQAARGAPVTESGFVDYCGVVARHGGFQPRDGKHKRGAAIDIDAKFNPYTVMGVLGGPSGGETPSNFRNPAERTALNTGALSAIRDAALSAYGRAVDFTFGSAAIDVRVRQPGELSGAIYDRFQRVNHGLRVYMNCGFSPALTANRTGSPTQSNSIPRNAAVDPRALDEIADTIRLHTPLFQGGNAPQRVGDLAFLQSFRDQVAVDHQAMRRACIYGKWTIDNGVQNFGSSRDPCFGIMNLRKPVAQALLDVRVDNKRLRWGAIDFGAEASGDVMHFDLGSLADAIQLTTEGNPDGIFFAP